VNGEDQQWSEQVNRTLAELERRLTALEALERAQDDAGEAVERRVLALESRVAAQGRELHTLEAKVEALDASFVRHQGQNEDDFRRAGEAVDRVGQDLSTHLDAHWRSR
jgi:hypothetical protein